MAVTRIQVINALKNYFDTGGALATAIASVNADDPATTLPSPRFYHFGERQIDVRLKVGQWIILIAYDRKATVEDESKYRLEDWMFVVVGVVHHTEQGTINKWVLKMEDAILRALDAQTAGAEQRWFGLDPATIKDMEIVSSGISPIELVGTTFFMETAIELRFRASICRV